jgi:hypothetical protein
LRKVTAEKLVRDVVPEEGGPLIHNGWEDATLVSLFGTIALVLAAIGSTAWSPIP